MTEPALTQELLVKLEAERDFKRKQTGRLTFDCYNSKSKSGGRVICGKGHLLGSAKDGSMAEIAVLRGITPATCKDCLDYEGGN